jgi:iron(III) transport system permease protein
MDLATSSAPPADGLGERQGKALSRLQGFFSVERIVLTFASAVLVVLVVYPVLWLVLGSLGAPAAYTFDYLKEILSEREYIRPFLNTIWLGVLVAVCTVLMGVPMAWAVCRTDMPWRGFLRSAPAIAFLTAPYLSALAYIMLLGPNAGLLSRAIKSLTGVAEVPIPIFGMPGVVFVISCHLFPYAFFLTASSLESMDASLEESAQILGASRFKVMLRITLPLVAPAITSAALLAFVASIALFGPQAFLGLPERVYFLPTKIFTLLSVYPPRYAEASGLGIGIILLTAVALYFQRRFLERKSYVVLSGKGTRPSRVKLGPWKYVLLAFSITIMVLAVVLPYSVFIVAAFSKQWLAGPSLDNLTFKWFPFVFLHEQRASRAIVNSFLLATGVATVTTLLGLLIAFIDLRTTIRGRRILDYLSIVPLGVPGIVLAVGLLQAWIRSPIPIYSTIWIIFIAYMTRYIPLSVRSSNTALRQVDPSLEEASRIAGGSWKATMQRITMPLVKPGLLVAWTLVFVPSLLELNTSILLYTQGTEVISVMIYKLNEMGQFEAISALALVTVTFAMAVLIIMRKLAGRSLEDLAGG